MIPLDTEYGFDYGLPQSLEAGLINFLNAKLPGTSTTDMRFNLAAIAAQTNNPVDLPPWLPCVPWAIGLVPDIGNVLAANGNEYVYTTAGAVAGSGTGPASVSYGLITDGAARCIYRGPVRTAAALPGAPLAGFINYSAATSIAQKLYDPRGVQSFFNFGCPVIDSGNGVIFPQLTSAEAVTSTVVPGVPGKGSVSPSFEFMSDSDYLLIKNSNSMTQPSARWQLEIDGRRLCENPLMSGSLGQPTGNCVFIDFRANGGRKVRKYKVYYRMGTTHAFEGVYVTGGSKVWQPPSSTRLCWWGESFHANHTVSGDDIGSLVGAKLGFSLTNNVSQGSSGFLTNGGGTPRYPWIQRINDALQYEHDALGLVVSYNDNAFTYQEKYDAYLAFLRAYTAAKPNNKVFVIGCWAALTNGVAAFTEQETAMVAAINTLKNINVHWIPIRTDPAGSWGIGRTSPAKVDAVSIATSAVIDSIGHGVVLNDDVMLQNLLGMTEAVGLVGRATTITSADRFTSSINTTGFTALAASANSYIQINDIVTEAGTNAANPGLHPQFGTGYRWLADRIASEIREILNGLAA